MVASKIVDSACFSIYCRVKDLELGLVLVVYLVQPKYTIKAIEIIKILTET